MAEKHPTETKEIWKPIASFPDYEVSNLGRVRRATAGQGTWPGRVLSPYKTPNGYRCIRLQRTSICPHCNHPAKTEHTAAIHVLVAAAFLGEQPSNMCVNHKDGQKANNCDSNLEYVTRSENSLHAYRIGLARPLQGEDKPNAKLTNQEVCDIREELLNYRWGDYSRLGRKYGVHGLYIRQIHLRQKRRVT